MWQYQKLSTWLGLGLVTIATSTGCATNVEEPLDDEVAMSAENAAESADALTAGGGRGGYGFDKFGPRRGLGLGRRYGHGFRGHGGFVGGYGHGGFDHDYGNFGYGDYGHGGGYGYGDYGYGGYGYGGYGQGDIDIYIEQNNGYGGYGGYDDYEDYNDYEDYYDDCGGPALYDDGWN